MLKLKDFFYLQKNDRQAILVLLGIIIVSFSLVLIIGKYDSKEGLSDNYPTNYSADGNGQHVGNYGNAGANTATERHPLYYKVDGIPHQLFPFDPNTADSTQLLKLGLQAWQVRSIYKYRAKGGIFREPSDFARVYGLTKRQYEVLAPYIIIGEDYQPAADYYGRNYSRDRYSRSNYSSRDNASSSNEDFGSSHDSQEGKVYSYPHKLKPGEYVAVNTADTAELMKIPGIGSYFAKTVVRHREQLGGFYSITQLKEIEGFPESALAFIKVNPEQIKKLNINQLSLNQLRRHPYINFYQAKAICDHRRLKGPLKSLEELKLLKDFPPDEIKRLQPYLNF